MKSQPGHSGLSYHPHMATLTEDVQGIVHRSDLGPDVVACAFRVLTTDEGEHIVDLMLVVHKEEWDDEAVQLCVVASEKLADAARGTNHSLGFLYRTSVEHQTRAEAEADLWTPVEVGVAC